jgi:hypothetical protein
MFGAAIVSMLLRKDCKRLGDLAAATMVVHQLERPPKLKLGDVTPVIPVVPLAPADQAAVVALAARARPELRDPGYGSDELWLLHQRVRRWAGVHERRVRVPPSQHDVQRRVREHHE